MSLYRRPPRSYWIVLAISSTALTSLGINHINQRDAHQAERIRMTSKLSILRELNDKYRSGVSMPPNELQRLLKLADLKKKEEPHAEETSWRQAVFGRKVPPEDEENELRKLQEIWEEALRQEPTQKNAIS